MARLFPRGRIFSPAFLLAGCFALAAAEPDTAAPPGGPGGAVSIEAVVAEALQKNPELEFYRAEIAAAKAGRITAGQWKNPEIIAELGSKRAWERGGGASLGDGPAWSVSVAQTFEWPGRIGLRKAIANRQVQLAELGLAQFQAALAARARQLGLAALSAQQRGEAAREVAERYRTVTEALVQRDPAGPTPLLEQRIVEAAAVALSRRAAEIERERQGALLELNQLRGQPAGVALRLAGAFNLNTNVPPLLRLLETAYTNNFELRMRQAELEQQGFQVRLARHERYPSVTLAPFYSSEKAADQERIVGVGLSVPLPLWNQGQGNVAAAEARVQQAEAAWRAACRDVERKITDRALAFETKREEMTKWRPDAARRFREAAELADQHYRLGAVPLTTYLGMQSGYLDALEALLATQSEALELREELAVLIGAAGDELSRP